MGQARWSLLLYPAAGEAGGSLRTTWRPGGWSGRASDADRAASEAARRARGNIRRYCAANGLNRLGTLTYAGEGCFDARQGRSDVAGFFKRLRADLGGDPLPYLWVPEWHGGGHGLHLHFAVGRYIKRSLIEDAWGRGIVHIKLLGDLPVGSGALEEARRAARYLGKYAGKAVDGERPAGLHRYGVAQGFKPAAVQLTGRSVDDVLGRAADRMGAAPSWVWHSSSAGWWQGPPACWAAWDA